MKRLQKIYSIQNRQAYENSEIKKKSKHKINFAFGIP